MSDLCVCVCLQQELERISESLRIPGSKSLGPVAKVHHKSAAATCCSAKPILLPCPCCDCPRSFRLFYSVSVPSVQWLQAFRKAESILGNQRQAIVAEFADDKKVHLTPALSLSSPDST